MREPFFRESYGDQLTRVYVALALAKDVTARWVEEKPEYEPLKGLITTLQVTSQMLEEILEKVLPEEDEQGVVDELIM